MGATVFVLVDSVGGQTEVTSVLLTSVAVRSFHLGNTVASNFETLKRGSSVGSSSRLFAASGIIGCGANSIRPIR